MKRFFLIFILAISCFSAALSVTLNDVSEMISQGEYQAALEAVTPLIKKSPRDATTNYWYGMALKYTGNYQQAVSALSTAADRGYLNAYPMLIELNISNYEIDKAQKNIDSWRAALKKARKSEPSDISELESRLTLMNNQMGRVEDMPVFARYDIASSDFQKNIEKLTNPLLEKGTVMINEPNSKVADIPFFINNTNREVFWTKKDNDGVSRLFTAGILDDGTLDQAEELTQFVGEGNILAPFMLQDGETLYFASDGGRDGLGGYDLYMTRRDGNGGFYEPSSLGMPYNSPGNDFLFVIDEENNVGWWATDRFSHAGDTISLLIFEPRTMRVNIDLDNENIASRAKVDNLKLTQSDSFDEASAMSRLKKIESTPSRNNQNTQANTFTLSLGNGRIITSSDQFRRPEAASLMSDVLRSRRILNDNIERLESMRNAYAEGDKTLKGEIRALEVEVERQQTEVKKLTNQVIQLETR